MPTKLETARVKHIALLEKSTRILDNPQLTQKQKIDQLKSFRTEMNDAEREVIELEFIEEQRKSLGLSDAGGSITPPAAAKAGTSYSTKAASEWGAKVESALKTAAAGRSAKALINGSVDVPSIISLPVEIAGRPTSVLQLVPRRPPRARTADNVNAGNTFGYLVQTSRALAARSVPDGARKPVSGITFEEREDRYRVYATLTEPLPKRYLDDYRQLVTILQNQLGEGLLESIEYDVLNGTGVTVPEVVNAQGVVTTAGEDPVRGILKTPGILVEDFAVDALTSLSNARFTLENTHVKPNAWALNPRDMQALTNLRENGATGALLFGTGRTSLEQFLGDYNIVTSPLIAQGEALLGDWNETELLVAEDDHIDVDGSGELFKRNQVQFRDEGRVGFAVRKPSAFVKVALKAA